MAATVAFGAALPEASPERFNPTAKPLATPIYDVPEQPLTNAERFRLGLNPLPPRIKEKRFGLHAPGPVAPPPPEPSAAPPTPSSTPDTPDADPGLIFEGLVQVADARSGKVLGYVSNKLTKSGQLSVDRDYHRSPLEVIFKSQRANQKPSSIKITSGDSRTGKFFGAVASEWARSGILGKGKDVFAYLTRTGETKSGHGPMKVLNAIRSRFGIKSQAQSALWTVNEITRELAAKWTNPDGHAVETTVFYYKKYNALAISADPKKFQAAHRDAVKVKLSIISKPLS